MTQRIINYTPEEYKNYKKKYRRIEFFLVSCIFFVVAYGLYIFPRQANGSIFWATVLGFTLLGFIFLGVSFR